MPAPSGLRRALESVEAIGPPASFFSGLTLARAMAPDNIVFFKHTDTAGFKPEGVSNNYHHRFELVAVLEKAGPVRIGETSYRLEPGEAALIFPHQFHHYMDVEAGPMQWLFITFELGDAGAAEAIAALRDAPRRLDPPSLELLGEIAGEYARPAGGGEPDALEISCRLARLLRRMTSAPAIPRQRRSLDPADKARDAILEKINAYVRRHLSQALTLGTLAEALGYSVSHLRTVFRTRLGISLGRYIRESRLSEAAKRLGSGETNISEAARASGFESLFAFSRAFRKAYGMSPKAYSKRLRERPQAAGRGGSQTPKRRKTAALQDAIAPNEAR